MKKFKFVFIALFLAGFVIIDSCQKKKDEVIEPVSESPGTLSLKLENDINGNKIILNSLTYLNENQDTFKVSSLKYYVSNIKLTDPSGKYYSIPESYYLIDVSISNDTTLNIPNIPAGNYTQIEMSIGIDSAHNHSGLQTGALDPTTSGDMFWSWSAGYKFVLLEGSFKTVNSNGYKPLVLHISDDGNMKNYTFNSGTANWKTIQIREGKTTDIKMNVNFEEMFKTPTTISFDAINNVAGGSQATTIANNYADMLKLTEIVNE